VIQGAHGYSIPQSHLTDMHEEVHIQQKGIKALQHITTMLKAESQEGYDELAQEKFKAESTTAIDVQRHEAAAAKAELVSELADANKRRDDDAKKLKEELKYMEDHFSQAEDRANDEEHEYQAEADAFERLRIEYNKNVKEAEDLEREELSRREQEKILLAAWPKFTETSEWKR